MDTFKAPTVNNLYDTLIGEYQTRTGQNPPLLQRAAIKAIAWGFSGIVILLWRFGSWQYLQVFVSTAGLDSLKKWGSLIGLDYDEGTTAVLKIHLTGITAIKITQGTVWKSLDNGLTYTSDADAAVVTGEADVIVTASETGEIGNLANGSILDITNPLTGIPDTAEVTDTITIGTEPQDVEEYRAEVQLRYRRRPQGGAAIDYFNWCTEGDGVIDALPYVFDPGQVDVYLVGSGTGDGREVAGSLYTNPFPIYVSGVAMPLSGTGLMLDTASLINKSLDSSYDDRRPVGTSVLLQNVDFQDYAIEIIGLSPSTTEINLAIKETLTSIFDGKRPELPALGYTEVNATIQQTEMSAIVYETLQDFGGGSFTSLEITKVATGVVVTDILAIHTLANFSLLTINGSSV